jgi:hypothetical protein
MDQIMPPLMGDDDDDEPDDAAADAVGMAPLSLEVWASFLAAYPEALELLMNIPFPVRSDDDLDPERSDDDLDFVD